MVLVFYDWIEVNEQFVVDVVYEIKNLLVLLWFVVGIMCVVKWDDQCEKLFEVIEYDVCWLDCLVSDILNVFCLDSELVKEDEEEFDLIKMLNNLGEFFGQQVQEKGVDFLIDFLNELIVVLGFEGCLVQVFVNLISNVMSFCEEGDVICLWVCWCDNCVLVVVEDIGLGILEGVLIKVFKWFYFEWFEGQFGNNLGLGLVILKQIVEVYGGVIWVENICFIEVDFIFDLLGVWFVVGLLV